MSTYSACSKRCKKPIVTAVQGIVFTIGIELMLAGDIVVAADDSRVLPDGIQARHCAARRRAFPLPVAHRLGKCHVSSFLCDESMHRVPRRSAASGGGAPGEQIERATGSSPLSSRGNVPLAFRSTCEAGSEYIEHGARACDR